jgi:hypothetical protein
MVSSTVPTRRIGCLRHLFVARAALHEHTAVGLLVHSPESRLLDRSLVWTCEARRSDASSVAAHSGRAERSNGYAAASIVDERIAIG